MERVRDDVRRRDPTQAGRQDARPQAPALAPQAVEPANGQTRRLLSKLSDDLVPRLCGEAGIIDFNDFFSKMGLEARPMTAENVALLLQAAMKDLSPDS